MTTLIDDNDQLIEITVTLNQIKKVDRMMEFHRQFDEPDVEAIENYLRLRADLLGQLGELLEAFGLEIKVPMAA